MHTYTITRGSTLNVTDSLEEEERAYPLIVTAKWLPSIPYVFKSLLDVSCERAEDRHAFTTVRVKESFCNQCLS